MCNRCSSVDRIVTAAKLLGDNAVSRTKLERVELVYHAVAYELYTYQINRLKRLRSKHGRAMNNEIKVAEFAHELQKL